MRDYGIKNSRSLSLSLSNNIVWRFCHVSLIEPWVFLEPRSGFVPVVSERVCHGV